MAVYTNHSLKPYNTFGIDCQASQFATFSSKEELRRLLGEYASPIFILGGGSNILLTKETVGTVLQNKITGIEVVEETENTKVVKVGGGEIWHDFVRWCIEEGLGGVENLSLIPGSVGAAPMQNIGAYGVEIQSVFEKLDAISMETLEEKVFDNASCRFSYRASIFKEELKGKYIITHVFFRVHKNPKYNTSYGAIEAELRNMGVVSPTLKTISAAVIRIRMRKLPDPKKIGNSGSFFKNPIISTEEFHNLQVKFPAVVGYTVSENEMKIAAGWLIDQAGWKGFRRGDAGIHEHHALVLVNYGDATGEELLRISQEVQHSVLRTFGISLENEVNIL